MGTETGIYSDLRKRLDKLPVGYPATESGVEVRLLKHLFTPEEARIALQLSMMPEAVGRIHKRLRRTVISVDELERTLDRMVDKGSIMLSKRDGEKRYSVMPLAVGSYEFQVERLTKDFALDMHRYMDGEFGTEICRTGIPQLRTIPIEKSLPTPDRYQVSSYDSIREIIKGGRSPIAVANCVCRQMKDILGDPCTTTNLRETCLIFGDYSGYYLDQGIGRSTTKDEALDILQKAQEAGLVLQPENTQHPGYVCCCCGDCCGVLTTVKRLPRPADMYASNYNAEVDDESCTGCGTCAQRCQLQALTVVDGVASVDLNRCIGCGNCVASCGLSAVRLRFKESESAPPKNTRALYMKILSKKVGRLGMLKMGAKMVLGLRV